MGMEAKLDLKEKIKPYYQDDYVTIYHGDCREVLQYLPIKKIDAVISDPPYGMDANTDSTRFSGGKYGDGRRGQGKVWGKIRGDAKRFDPTPWVQFPRVVLWGYNHFAQRVKTGTVLIWLKRNDRLFGTFLSDAELAWMKGGYGVYAFRKEFPPPVRAIETGGNPCNPVTVHPTQKPLGLMGWCIDKAKIPYGGLILDPFMGSGTTLRAAKNIGRRAIGIEIEERYCEIAAKRMRQEVLNFSNGESGRRRGCNEVWPEKELF